MTRYGQFCPMAKAAEIVAERWTLLLIRELLAGSTRFNDLRRGVPLMSPALLSQRLQQLEREGVIERRTNPGRQVREYRLTDAGRALAPVVRHLGDWGARWVIDRLDEDDLDVTLLMWAMRRRVDPAAFGPCRTVVAFEFSDVPWNKRRWWLVNDGAEVDLCPKDPGFEVNLFVIGRLRPMIEIWVGRSTLEAGLRAGLIELSGNRALREQFKRWLLLSPFAASASEKAESAPPPSQPSTLSSAHRKRKASSDTGRA
jgi:DNA-binding HxlR family transcriptional regulator